MPYKKYNLLFFFLLLTNFSWLNAQEKVYLTFNPVEGRTYSYTNQMFMQVLYVTGQKEVVYAKNAEGHFVEQTRIKGINLGQGPDSPIFSLVSALEPSHPDYYNQKALNDLVVVQEIDTLGREVKPFEFREWLLNKPYFNEVSEQAATIVESMTAVGSYYFLGDTLEIGKTLREEATEDSPLIFDYIIAISDGYTYIMSYTDNSKDPTNEKKRRSIAVTVSFIENATGLPVFEASSFGLGEDAVIYATWRDDFKVLKPELLPLIKADYDNRDTPSTVYFESEFKSLKKNTVRRILASTPITGRVHDEPSTAVLTYVLETDDGETRPEIVVNHISCTMRDGAERLLVRKNDGMLDLRLYNKGLQAFPPVFVGENDQVSKVAADIDILGYYGLRTIELTQEDAGKRLELTKGPFILSEWDAHSVVLSEADFRAYNARGEWLTQAEKKRVWPQQNLLKAVYAVPDDEGAVPTLTWIMAPLFPKYADVWNYEYVFEEPVAKIILADAKGSVVVNRVVESKVEQPKAEAIEDLIPADGPASFPGGSGAMKRFIDDHLRYPETALENKIEGIVFIQFAIEKDGSLSNVRVTRGMHPAMDKEAVRLIESMPPWHPERQNNQPVKTSHTLPIRFRLP